jgi:hypothetical protein
VAATTTKPASWMSHAAHSMGRELAEPDWLPLTDDELLGILGRSDPGGLGRQPVVIWRSPRPMSAAALVRHGDVTVFVKRHHVSVRTPEQLAVEHEFATHLRTRELPVPAVVRLADGRSVLRRGDFCYEVHQAAGGVDLYRDAVSWSPYASLGHAYAAGVALARLHLAAADLGRPARPPAVLMNSCQVIAAPDPLDMVSWLDLPETGTASADLAAAAVLLDGYQTVRPLTEAEAIALPLVLPVVHVEYALSEADYFTSVAISLANADLAYEYLIGHARWFGQPPGAALLRFLSDYCASSGR